jgi:microcystin-dependent protein
MEGYIAEIRMFAGNFAPRAWAFCNGQSLSIAQNTALFSLLGTTYGGNGQTTFNLPDLRGRVPVGTGNGPGLTPRILGEMAGTQTNTLISTNMPAHAHTMNASSDVASVGSPAGNSLGANARGGITPFAPGNANQVPMGSMTGISGSNSPVNNMQPYLGMNYIICLEGIYPSRN